MYHPLVSVIIPTFERPFYLKRAIESVLKQTYNNLELIVVIDGKSAKSQELVNQYKNNYSIRIVCVETSEKVGGSEARNIGARLAHGDFIALLDDDDEWLSDKISAQITLIQSKDLTKKENFICFTSVFVYDSIEQPEYTQLPIINYKDSSLEKLADYLFETKGLTRIGWIQTSTILVPTRLLLVVPFTKGLPKHQDWDWLLKLDKLVQLQVIQVEAPMAIYHSDVPKTNRVGISNQWRFSEKWLVDHQSDFSQKGYESFILDLLLPGVATDAALTKKDRTKEIKRLLSQLSLKAYFRLFTWKMLSYLAIRNNTFLFKNIENSAFLTNVKNKLF